VKNTFNKNIIIDNHTYNLDIVKNVDENINKTRILIPTFIANETHKNVTRVCIESVRKFTSDDVEIWVINNNSPEQYSDWLTKLSTELKFNLVLNRTEPVNPLHRRNPNSTPVTKYWRLLTHKWKSYERGRQSTDGSYANAIGLELGSKCINSNSKTIFTMHSDSIVTKKTWLSHLKSKLNEKVQASTFRTDPRRVYAAHIGGLLLNYSLFQDLNMTFMPNMRKERYSNQPEYDVGDQISLKLKANGYDFFSSPNTFNDPSLINLIDDNSPYLTLACDKCFDDKNEVFYMHMGRGTHKSSGRYQYDPEKTFPEQWIDFADKHILNK
tara:strand:+ start:445 stop:1422 length:978 start_codon:yes stop_codon:yes gene_type:complete